MGVTNYYTHEEAIIRRLEEKLTNVQVISVRDAEQIKNIQSFDFAVVVAMGDDAEGVSSVGKRGANLVVSVSVEQRFYVTIISNNASQASASFNNMPHLDEGAFIMEVLEALSGFEPSPNSGRLLRNFDDNTSYSLTQNKKMFGFTCKMLYSTNLT